jgi:hypothetical protein
VGFRFQQKSGFRTAEILAESSDLDLAILGMVYLPPGYQSVSEQQIPVEII